MLKIRVYILTLLKMRSKNDPLEREGGGIKVISCQIYKGQGKTVHGRKAIDK